MKHTTIAVDLAKSVFEVAVSDQPGRVRERKRLSRTAFIRFMARQKPARVLLEACGSAHFWGRFLGSMDHRVILLPPHGVRPYIPRNKTDRADAKGLLEADRNEQLRPVPVKSIAQQSLTALHRLRGAWFAARTARINTVRGLLREFGITIPVGSRNVVPRMRELLSDEESALPVALHPILREACGEIIELDRRIKLVERQLRQLARETPVVGRLLTIPGIGLLTATAFVGFVGDVGRFPSGRHLSSYLGLTPRERSSGLVRRLGAISKRGNIYLRMLLTHGARAVLRAAKIGNNRDRLRLWGIRVEQRRGHNKAAIALANKMARIAWAVCRQEGGYRVFAAA